MALPIPNSNHVNKRCCAKKKITAKSYYYNSNAEQKRTNQQCPLRVFPFHLKMNSGVARRIFMFFPCLDGVMFWLVDIIFKFIQYRHIAHTFGSKMQSSFSLGFHLVNGFALVWVQLVSELSSHTHTWRQTYRYIHTHEANVKYSNCVQNTTKCHIWNAAASLNCCLLYDKLHSHTYMDCSSSGSQMRKNSHMWVNCVHWLSYFHWDYL